MTDVSAVATGLSRTVPVYWKNSYQKKLRSKIVKAVKDEKRYWYVALDETIFHPKGGGQPTDRGMLVGKGFRLEVKKAMLAGDRVIVHWGKTVEGVPVDGPVAARIDWEWRFLMMRRHTTAHLLDYCLAEAVGSNVETLDSWLGDPCYVAYRGEPPSSEQLVEVEKLENKIIANGRPVEARELDTAQLKQAYAEMPNLQSLPNMEKLRLVTIEGCSPIACGGTHLRNLSEAKGIRIERTETMTDGFRIYYNIL